MALSKKGKSILKKIPKEPGVYIMKDGKNEILYIGKAKDLRNRVKTYFDSNTFLSPQKIEMVRQIEDVEYIVVGSEEEALILEANLVKFNQRGPQGRQAVPLHQDNQRGFPRHMQDQGFAR
jgi:excinuclease UvrABC nuclease subunit